jgi:hypothetical protein
MDTFAVMGNQAVADTFKSVGVPLLLDTADEQTVAQEIGQRQDDSIIVVLTTPVSAKSKKFADILITRGFRVVFTQSPDDDPIDIEFARTIDEDSTVNDLLRLAGQTPLPDGNVILDYGPLDDEPEPVQPQAPTLSEPARPTEPPRPEPVQPESVQPTVPVVQPTVPVLDMPDFADEDSEPEPELVDDIPTPIAPPPIVRPRPTIVYVDDDQDAVEPDLPPINTEPVRPESINTEPINTEPVRLEPAPPPQLVSPVVPPPPPPPALKPPEEDYWTPPFLAPPEPQEDFWVPPSAPDQEDTAAISRHIAEQVVNSNAGIVDARTIAPVLGVESDDRPKAKVVVVFSGKGGTGKTSTSILLAKIAASAQPDSRVVLVDGNRGQGDVRQFLWRDVPRDVPSISDYALGTPMAKCLIDPREVQMDDVRFWTLLAPLVDETITIQPYHYARAIEELRYVCDLIVVDTQSAEVNDTALILTEAMLPLLRETGDGFGLCLFDASKSSKPNGVAVCQSYVNQGVEPSSLYALFNRLPLEISEPDTARSLSGLCTLIGTVPDMQHVIDSAAIARNLPADSKYASVLMKFLCDVTGDPIYNELSSTVTSLPDRSKSLVERVSELASFIRRK